MVTNDVYLIKMIAGQEMLEQSIREKFDDDESIFATLDAALSYIMAFDYYVPENPHYYHEKTYLEQRFESGTWIVRKVGVLSWEHKLVGGNRERQVFDIEIAIFRTALRH